MKKLFLLFILLLGIGLFSPVWAQHRGKQQGILSNVTAQVKTLFQQQRPFQDPVFIQNPNLPNTYQISPILYRGGQPNEKGYRWLASHGVKTVVSLRTTPPDEALLQKLGLKSINIPINPYLFRDAHAVKFLKIVNDPANQPVFLHCRHGSDRTGTMVAIYRMAIENWPLNRALNEMRDPRFGFHKEFFTLPAYLEEVNITAIKQQANINTHYLAVTPPQTLCPAK